MAEATNKSGLIVQLNKKLADVRKEGKSLVEEMETKYKADPTAYTPGEYNEKLERIQTDGLALVEQIKSLTALEGIQSFQDDVDPNGPDLKATGNMPERRGAMMVESWGSLFVKSQEYKSMIDLGLEKSKPVNVKAQYSGTGSAGGSGAAYGGYLLQRERMNTVIDREPLRPRTLTSIVGRGQTTSDAIEYPIIASKTNGADTVPERNAGNTDFGTKPQSEMTFELVTEVVRTIAHWIPVSRQIIMDAPSLRSMIDNFLDDGLELKLENLILSGSGTNEFRGILNTSGIQSRVHKTSGRAFSAADTIVDTIRRAITDINIAFFRADGVILHPTEAEELELLKDDNKNYMNIFDPLAQRVWRIPVIETQAITAGTALVGNFRQGCMLWDRMKTDIRIGEPNDFFIKNAIAVLAELRAMFGVIYPEMFEKVTGLGL